MISNDKMVEIKKLKYLGIKIYSDLEKNMK